MLRKDSGSPPQPSPLSGAQQPSSMQHSAEASSPPINPLRSSGGMRHLLSESEGASAGGVGGVINERHRLSAEILHGSPKEERRRLSIMATLAAAGEASKDYDTYRCDRENVTTLNALEAEVHALEAEVKLLERVASGDALNLDSDSEVTVAAMSASSPDIGALIQRKITSSAPIQTRTKHRASLGEARSHSDADREQASGQAQGVFGQGSNRSNHKRDDVAHEDDDEDKQDGDDQGDHRRGGLSKRSLSADYTNDSTSNGSSVTTSDGQTTMANGDCDEADGGTTTPIELDKDEEEDGGDGDHVERPPQSRLSWVKAGSPSWRPRASESGEIKTSKRKSMSDLQLVKEERRGFNPKVPPPCLCSRA
jgi:hypothetical protein